MEFVDTLFGRPNTVKVQACLFKKHIQPRLARERAIEFGEPDFITLVKRWAEDDLKPRTINSLIGILVRYIKWAGGSYVPDRRLISKIKRMEVPERSRGLTKAEALRLLQTAKETDPTMYSVILFAMHGGLRKGEVFGLTWDDIDLIQGEIHVRRSYDGPTKNGRSRVVPLSSELEKVITGCYNCTGKGGNTKLFQVFDPNPRLKRLCELAKIPAITFHGLRHTFATLALEARRSPKSVQQVLGHSSVRTTLEVYWDKVENKLDMGFLD